MQYFKDILSGAKQGLPKDKINNVKVQRFSEFDTKSALSLVEQDALSMLFIPNNWLKPKAKVDREFAWIVMASEDQILLSSC